MKYVITGVDGKLGGRVAENMISSANPEELIFTCPEPGRIDSELRNCWKSLGIELRQANYDDPEGMEKSFAGGTRLFMVSGVLIGDKRVRQHKNVIDAAVNAGMEHITYTSFLGATNPAYAHVYVTPDHTATEFYLRDCGLDFNVMRNNLYLENYLTTSVMLSLMSGNKWYTTAGEGKATFIAKDDSALAGSALLLGAGQGRQAYIITGSQSVSQRELCELVSNASGINIEYCPVDQEEFFRYLDSINIPRDTDQNFSASPVPWCGNDMVTNEASIAEGLLDVKSTDFTFLTCRKPRTAQDLINNYRYIWENKVTHWRDIK
ncbi:MULTISPECIES: NmrA family NAD(P)-binding protein [Enterobacteriaceae]|uniref:NmrA family NAD(P)-binding protein n=1 Tax=Enterobacteriaceae TaxID=543 RepID=UPI000237D079|nr:MULTISPECIES: NmrA family NAD(P)-binding protein [Enterobacteriaceae]QNE50905.1 NmrA family NAD(P)-binding protein [Klebsiella michiganensis]